MLRVACRLLVAIGLVVLLLPRAASHSVSAAALPLTTGWSSVNMGPLLTQNRPVSAPFFVVRGGPGLVAISQAANGHTPNVWASTDGRSWRYKPLDPRSFGDVKLLSAPVLGKRGLVMVGTAQEPQSAGHVPVQHGVVWTSRNGLSWQRTRDADNVFKGVFLSSVSAGGPGYVAVGTVTSQNSPANLRSNRGVIWVSHDGVHWRESSDGGAEFARASIADVASGGPGLVAGGFAYSIPGHPPRAVIWTSVNGMVWRRLSSSSTFPEGSGVERIVAGRSSLLALGHEGAGQGLAPETIWASPDGTHWRRVARNPFGIGYRTPVVTALSTGFAAAGQCDNAAAVWWSADGSRWTLAAGSDVFGGGLTTLASAVAWRNGLLVVGQTSNPPTLTSTAHTIVPRQLAWLWTPGAPNASHPDWAAADPMWFRLRLADVGPRFIPRTPTYSMACALIPTFRLRSTLHARIEPVATVGVASVRCERSLATLAGSIVYSFNFGYGTRNLYGEEPEITGFSILTRTVKQSRAAYKVGGGLVIAGDLNENIGAPQPLAAVRMAQGGTLYRIATHGYASAYAVVWRTGRALGMVEVVGLGGDLRSRAIALARSQWMHWRAAVQCGRERC